MGAIPTNSIRTHPLLHHLIQLMMTEILAARKPLAKEMGIELWDKLNYRHVGV